MVHMKSTKVQNPRRKSRGKYILRTIYTNARAEKLATPRVVAERVVVLSVLALTRATASVGIVLGKAECC